MKVVSKADLIRRFKGARWQHELLILNYDPMAGYDLFQIDRLARLYVPKRHSKSAFIAHILHDVWRSLPVSVRRRLWRYWREKITVGYFPGAPVVEISDVAEALAASSGGTSFSFHGGLIGELNGLLVRDVIAHEFAHAWNRTFQDSVITTQHQNAEYQAEIEREADITANYWGRNLRIPFCMARWREWGASHPDEVAKHLNRQETWILPDSGGDKCEIIHPKARKVDAPFS